MLISGRKPLELPLSRVRSVPSCISCAVSFPLLVPPESSIHSLGLKLSNERSGMITNTIMQVSLLSISVRGLIPSWVSFTVTSSTNRWSLSAHESVGVSLFLCGPFSFWSPSKYYLRELCQVSPSSRSMCFRLYGRINVKVAMVEGEGDVQRTSVIFR